MKADFGKFTERLVRNAGRIVKEGSGQSLTVEHKGAVNLVTNVDIASERYIVETIHATFPDHDILTEESDPPDRKTPSSSCKWIIDPLDGTTNFAHGYPRYCVSIALEVKGEIMLGMVYDPLMDELFRAERGKGAFLNEKKLRVSPAETLSESLLATGFPYDRRELLDHHLAYFKAFMMKCRGIRRDGSAALNLCYVAAGRLDGFWEENLAPWDVAAGMVIVDEAGGNVTDFAGKSYALNKKEILASNGKIHAEMIAATQAIKPSNAI